MAMNSNKHKISSILFTTLIIFTLVLMGPASAITINIGEPNDANQGEDVQFQVSVDLDTPDMYLPIAYTTLIFTNPDNTQFECRVYNDGSTNCDNIEVIVTSNLTYGQGIQYGYGYGYGYGYEYTHFGYGYGYGYAGENGQMTYDVTLHLESDSQIGDYAVRAETYVASEDSINSEYSPCEIMLGMYRTHYVLINQEGSYYDPELDLNEDGTFMNEAISAREKGEFQVVPKDNVDLMDVSPSQLVSVSASLIPFLEHDDANRALMGSNMQRQAVPLLRASSPLVGTGFERNISRDSGVTVLARNSGYVDYIDSSKIVIKRDKASPTGEVSDIYSLIKFERSNQNTCWNQKPIVKKGQKIKTGDIIADGPSTEFGELALGKNITVAFMPWGGYNFEDAILISEKLSKKDTFTSLHIEEFECISRETKLGKEEITRDIPNVNEDHLSFLDKEGVIQIGAEVKPNDVLVGKISPKGETQLSPEERLLRAIFGDKAGDVKDTSLRVPPGVNGIVLDVKHLISRIGDKQDKSRSGSPEVLELIKERDKEIEIVQIETRINLKKLFISKKSINAVRDGRKVVLKKDAIIDDDNFDLVPYQKIITIEFDGKENVVKKIEDTLKISEEKINSIESRYSEEIEKLSKPDDLPPGVLKVVKVYVAVKRKHQVGDKMAGRHGNKGVVSRVLAEEDMPYMSDGTPVDMVLNPLGVPSRMNVGQVLETHLGLAAKALGIQIQEHLDKNYSDFDGLKEILSKIYPNNLDYIENVKKLPKEDLLTLSKRLIDGVPVETPIFEGVKETEIRSLLKDNHLPEDGKLILFNGQTGEPFDQRVTVGIMYMIKLHHLVEEKIHARAIGPYSLVTQQPLGGKSHFGGQRLGEMEVWALEAYGAANTLQEFLTVKSDDVIGRTRLFDSIVKNKVNFEPGIPESFNVLTNELKSLGLNIKLENEKDPKKSIVSGEISND